LYCISVDDAAYSNVNWPWDKDSWAVYSNDCTVGIEDNEPTQAIITSYNRTITIKGKGTATVFNLQGQRVHQSKLTGKTSITLDKGIYLVRVTSEGRSVTKKVYLN
ncbi:MAG: T9SS type A sorting domain-containing protein, partial [Bacteroidetes bacterium]|nr:T9SS type A sorting domain-containing protein [Bacteroidota bacterium]